jgi:hypothetical protein
MVFGYPRDERSWATCEDLHLLASVYTLQHAGSGGERRYRLFAVASLRTVWDRLDDPRSRTAIEVAERHADRSDGLALANGHRAAEAAVREVEARTAPGDARRDLFWAASAAALPTLDDGAENIPTWAMVAAACSESVRPGSHNVPIGTYLSLFHDIIPNPFRPTRLDVARLGPTAVGLARRMYDSRDFTAMPVLGDALCDSGCDDAGVLAHCRDEGLHVRGCWVVDLILGRE